MKKLLLATTALALGAGAAVAEDIKIGVILGFTGPTESLSVDWAASGEFAMQEVNDSGLLLGGSKLVPVRGDSTCVDASAATAAAERLVTSDGVAAIFGADCSGVTSAVLTNVAVPNGVAMVSPTATSPSLSTVEDNGLFFRTAPSDARQGEVIANILAGKGISEIAISYVNNDYGKGLADSFQAAFEATGGSVAISAAHEDGKADYSAEVGALAASGAEHLAVFGYIDQGGRGIIQASLDTGAFDTFVLGDGMIGASLLENFGSDLDGSIGTAPGSAGGGIEILSGLLKGVLKDPSVPYRAESYDAVALIALAIQAGGSADRASIAANITNVANAPGELIMPGELAKALQILADGGEVNYEGGTGLELIGPGEAAGAYIEYSIANGEWVEEKVH